MANPPLLHPSLAFCVASPAVCSFVGLVIVANKQVACSIDLSHAFTFASGALLTVSLLSLVPEATEVRRRLPCTTKAASWSSLGAKYCRR